MPLTQAETDRYLTLLKRFTSKEPLKLGLPELVSRDLVSDDGREKFRLEAWFGSVLLSRYKYQNTVRLHVPLVRLCVGPHLRHTNPGGAIIRGSHLHVYREDYADRWAEPAQDCGFTEVEDFGETMRVFCRFCNIVDVPEIQLGML